MSLLPPVVEKDEFPMTVKLVKRGLYLCTVITGVNDELKEYWDSLECCNHYVSIDLDYNEPEISVEINLHSPSGDILEWTEVFPRDDGRSAFTVGIERILEKHKAKKA